MPHPSPFRFALAPLIALALAAACGDEGATEGDVGDSNTKSKAGSGGKSTGGKGGGGGSGGSGGSGGGGWPGGTGGSSGGSVSGQGGAPAAGGGGAPVAGSGGTTPGGSGGSGGSGPVAGSSASGSGGSGPQLACDSRFSFSATPLKAGEPFQVAFTDPQGFPWIEMQAEGPGSPSVSNQVISGSGPYTWSYTVSGHAEGVLTLRFYRDKPPGSAGVLEGTCQRQVMPGQGGTGGNGGSGGSSTAGSGGSGGGSGSGGSGPVGETCSTPIEMVNGTSGTYFVLDFNCPQLQLVQSPIYGSPPNQTSYRSTLAKWLSDYNGANDIAFAFNTNYSQVQADPITGAYVYDSAIYQTVFLVNCTESGGCPTSCFLEHARYSVGLGGDGKLFDLAYNPPYDWGSCSAMGCQGCKDLNWNTNMPIKWHVGSNNGIIPPATRWLVSGVDIETGVPSHNGKPDVFSESLNSRNVMAKVIGKNKAVVGLLTGASRGPVKSYMTSTFGVGQIIVFDGGGSTKQYISFQGKSQNVDGSRPVPGILGFKIK